MGEKGRVHSTGNIKDTIYYLFSSYVRTSINAYKASSSTEVRKFYEDNLRKAFYREKFEPLKLVPCLLSYKDSRLEQIAALIIRDFYKPSQTL